MTTSDRRKGANLNRYDALSWDREDREKGYVRGPWRLPCGGVKLKITARYPACHVSVGGKAPWFEITDDLPQ